MSVSAFHMRCGPLSKASATVKPKHSLIARLVELSAARAWTVATVAIVLCVAATLYVASNFAMTTDIDNLLSSKLGWRMRQADFDKAFPSDGSNLVVVIDGRTAELSQEAAARLTASLRAQNESFHSVRRPDAGPFWAHEGLLFASISDVRRSIAQLLEAQPFLGSMAADPSLRGLANTLSLTMQGAIAGQATPQELRAPIRSLADAFDDLLRGKSAFFSWHSLMAGQKPDRRELRRIILVDPVLDFTQLRPGQLSVDAIRGTAKRLGLDSAHGVRVRVTGTVALEDDEFATLAQRAGLIASVATAAIILMLWFAVRSPRLIASILLTMVAGLVATTALGLALYHRFNLISVAFIPLFVGMGMDLGIQFSVRYRAERKPGWDVTRALIATGRTMGTSLILAAVAIAVGFLAFAPTEYYGVSQLGVIAGLGIIIALVLALTLLPALIALTRAPGAPQKAASGRLTVIDDYISRHRESVVVVGAAVAVASFVLLPRLQFDFNPMHLRSPTVESVATLDDLMHDPDLSPNTLEVIRPNLAQADQLAGVFRNDPTVSGARTLSTFIPKEQPQKIALLSDAANLLDFTLNPLDVASAPTDEQVIDSLQRAAAKLRQATIADSATRVDARRLANAFDRLAQDSPAIRARAARMIVPGFATTLGQIRDLLHPQPVTLETLPTDIVHQWLTADGRARVSILPKGDSNNDAVLRRFVTAGIRMAPDATGTAAYIQEYARAVVNAFVEAGVLSFVVIAGLLFAVLRRLRDVAITMAPIVLTGLLTMDTCVLIGQPLNFANIIALPLLFGIGVAFHIYFVMSWRAGGSHLLTSSLARGIFFSALATATGFGSLWASKHPGTASMGELLMISLIWTLASALVFQPALMSLANPKTPVRVIAAGPIFALGRSPAHQERRDP